jgi:hypothetical protein
VAGSATIPLAFSHLYKAQNIVGMEVLFHLAFQLVKVSLQSSIYAILLLGLFRIWVRGTDNFNLWLNLAGLILVLLMLYGSFSHYGNHGLGDSSRLPLAHGRTIHLSSKTYIKLDGSKIDSEIYIDKFALSEKYVFGYLDNSQTNYDKIYFVFDLQRNKVSQFEKEADYLAFLVQAHINPDTKLADFFEHYHNYWSGWRFWLLP